MFTVRYLGRLFNAQDGFVLKSHPLHSEMSEYNLTLHAQLEISNNNVVLTCKTTRYDAAIHPAIFGRCIDFAKAYMAISTFASGIGHTLVFTEFVDPDGKTFPVFFGNRHATQLCKSFSLPQD